MNLRGNIIAESGYTKDNTEKTAITMSDGTDEQQQQHSLLTLGSNIQAQPNPLVPIISVTPHSPGLAKNYPVLGKFLLFLICVTLCVTMYQTLYELMLKHFVCFCG